jgi:hypothetical protein
LFFIRKDKNLTAPLTLVLSRRGREELKVCPLTLTLSRGVEREKRERMEGKILKDPSP